MLLSIAVFSLLLLLGSTHHILALLVLFLVKDKKVHCTHLSTAMATSVKTEADTDIP